MEVPVDTHPDSVTAETFSLVGEDRKRS
jgi:hypothetical protein